MLINVNTFYRFKVGKTSPQMVGDVFRCLVAAIGDQEARVMMPLLASGGQVFITLTVLYLNLLCKDGWCMCFYYTL